ncbi:g301 [Coccomyxa viridis]|uniref:G301 protein n=1 Tax=Coccomyxa viridis TaxID=1274662 RepID=A0ABP1FFD9_9CHLO
MCCRERQDQLERAWWEEKAELSAGPAEQGAGGRFSDTKQEPESGHTSWQAFLQGEGQGEAVGQLVRGGLYEVDMLRRRMRCVYWPEHAHRISRGTWFVEKAPDWVPLKETTADELEEAYRGEVWNPARGHTKEQKQGITAARLELRTMTQECKGMYALFVSADEMYLCIDSYSSWITRKLTSTTMVGMRLRRGYTAPAANAAEVDLGREETDDFAARVPVDKLVFVVHGIGQNLSGSNIGEDASNVRHNLRVLAATELPEKDREAGRTEVLPVQWRKHLRLDVDDVAEKLMPPGVRSLRNMLHATAVEVLLYLTPVHCHDMLSSLVEAMNAQFSRFMLRHPDFQGKVSIMAHSLGSVLTYDILCNQPDLYSALNVRPLSASPSNRRSSAPDLQLEALRSTELSGGMGRPGSSEDLASPPSLGSVGKTGSGIHPELVDLTCMLSPGSSNSQEGQRDEEKRLRVENMRLRRELAQAKSAASSAAGPTGSSSPSGSRWQAAATAQEHSQLAPAVPIPDLNFTVDQFFAVGSPLGLFLALRKVDPSKARGLGTRAAAGLMLGAQASQPSCGDGLPAVHRMYNLYHPFDPVGYRMEPLILEGAELRRPVFAAYAKGGRRLHVGMQEMGEDFTAAMNAGAATVTGGMAKASTALFAGIASLKVQAVRAGNSISIRRVDAEENQGLKEDEGNPEEDLVENEALQSSSHGLKNTAIWRLLDGPGATPEVAARTPVANRTAAGRLDFVLQTGPTENPWLSAISSHFGYWTSLDTALFVLRGLHGLDVRQGVSKADAASGSPPATSPTMSPATAAAH